MKKSTILLNTRCKQSLSEHSWSITSWQNRMLWCMWQDFSNSRGWMLGERFDYGNWVIRDPPFIHMQQRVSGIIQNLFDHLSLLKILWWVFPWKLWISIWCRDQTSFLSALFKKKKKKKPLEDTVLKLPKQQNKYQTMTTKTLKENSCNLLDPRPPRLPKVRAELLPAVFMACF